MASDRDVLQGVIQLANLLTRRLGPTFVRAGVTPQQWTVLSTIQSAGEPTSLVALSRRLLVTKQNMTGMITRLEELGLVERADDPEDLRSWRVQLTRRGKSLLEKVRPAYDAWRVDLLSELGERDAQTLERSVERLIARLEAEPPEA
jgi:DNA-binding MarR family transcriptional regulator